MTGPEAKARELIDQRQLQDGVVQYMAQLNPAANHVVAVREILTDTPDPPTTCCRWTAPARWRT